VLYIVHSIGKHEGKITTILESNKNKRHKTRTSTKKGSSAEVRQLMGREGKDVQMGFEP
jgi:hypothetical protein